MSAITSETGQSVACPTQPLPLSKVLLVDDHALFAQGLAGLIRQEGLAESVITASSVAVASGRLARQDDFQLILPDTALQGEGGAGAGPGGPAARAGGRPRCFLERGLERAGAAVAGTGVSARRAPSREEDKGH